MRQNKVIYPAILAEALEGMLSAPLTLLSAGSGFGKTTAVSVFLERRLSDTDSSCYWYTCFGEPPERAWPGICRLLAHADEKISGYLNKLDMPQPDLFGYVAQLMDEMDCKRDTVLVIDNFQLAGFPDPYRLLDALSLHRCPKLHIIVLTQPLREGEMLDVSHPQIYKISQSALCFTAPDIQKLFAASDAKITPVQAKRLYEETGGWIAALQLHLSGFLSTGRFNEQTGMGELMERVFWRSLDEDARRFGVMLSVLDTFTETQAAVLLNSPVVPNHLWILVRSNSFVRESGGIYTLHTLLREFWKEKLAMYDGKFRRLVWRQAGRACRIQSKNVDAVRFLIRAGEDTEAFEVPLAEPDMDELVIFYSKEVSDWLLRVPLDALSLYPEKLLAFGIKAALSQISPELVKAAERQLYKLLSNTLLSGEKRTYIEAALQYLMSFCVYNDASRMIEHHKRAWKLVGRQIHKTCYPWTSCVPSVTFKFWRETGTLKETCRTISEGIRFYCALTGGSGMGSAEAMQSELELLSGNEGGAEVMAHKALYLSNAYGQDSVAFCARLSLCLLALLRGDAPAFQRELNAINRRAFGEDCQELNAGGTFDNGSEAHCVISADVCKGFLFSMLELEDRIPEWLLDLSAIRQYLWPISVPFAQMIYARSIRKKDPIRFLAITEEFIREAGEFHIVFPQIYYRLEQAVRHEECGLRAEALECVEQAMGYALPDKVYLPFAERYAKLSGVFCDSKFYYKGSQELTAICRLGKRMTDGMAAVRAFLIPGSTPLTAREREIALLAKTRHTNQEIAEKLEISPITVKNTLAKVYDKLNIHGKTELAELYF